MPGRPGDTLAARGIPPVTRHADIACRGADVDEFFPTSGQKPQIALRICRRCNHTAECLDWAVRTDQRFGVWGGTTAEDRRRTAAEGAK